MGARQHRRVVAADPDARCRRFWRAGGRILEIAALLRAFGFASDSGRFRIGNTDNAGASLGQTAMRSPSVFNFFRPGYVPPGTSLSAGAVAPEFQLVNESSVAGYLNFMQVAFGDHEINAQSIAAWLQTHEHVLDLRAISTGAVFFGAMTYIGNGPNFMVKAIAEAGLIRMPSFFGYLGRALAILLPILVLNWYVFFVVLR